MRKLKVRAWDITESKWIEINKIGFLDNGKAWYVEDHEKTDPPYFTDINDWALMHYTGLKDKNSKEIYEGDIVWCPWKGEKFIIEWDEIGTGYLFHNVDYKERTHGIDYYEFEDMCASLGFEVIGNIYENPELINS
ncbi:YopX family protein [Cytobacillus gottheilii]|uniref:YopX protein domain-containing protein n=1 Tax=Cytobacillus gottheilii TaxID=859144 RepID=A0ABX8FG25_9BACI|nr:YopX family protein [Cytobacillus gottheilii]QVY62945.1 hypothetical protein J1899_07845 [Cytobacillus gottheilii]